MNKIWKRIISMILMLTMISGYSLTTFAEYTKESYESQGLEKTDEGAFIMRDSKSSVYVKGYDLENGDSVFEQYNNGTLTSKYTVLRSQNIIRAVYYTEGSSSTENISVPRAENSRSELRGTTSGRLGRIRFQYTSGEGAGICGAYVDYVKNTGSIKYDINGTYRDLASLASFVASVLSLPSAPAMGIAKSVLTYLGIGLGALTFVIPQMNLQSAYEEIEYKLTDIDVSSHKNSFYGTRYVITETGGHLNDVYTEGTYFPTSSWGDQNFGTTIYNHLFTYSFWNISSWN